MAPVPLRQSVTAASEPRRGRRLAAATRGGGAVESTVGELLEPSARDATTAVRLSAVQGNVTPGFRKDYQAFVLIHFPDRPAGRRWLRAVQPDVASAEEVAAFDRLFTLLGRRRTDQETRFGRATWVNLALSWGGLEVLG